MHSHADPQIFYWWNCAALGSLMTLIRAESFIWLNDDIWEEFSLYFQSSFAQLGLLFFEGVMASV